MLLVPKQIPAATIDPTKYEALNKEVSTGLSLGYPSSPSKADPATMQTGMPNPRMMREMMYMAALTEKHCTIAPMIMRAEPEKIDQRRPTLSLIKGTKGRLRTAPSGYEAVRIPLVAPCGLSKTAKLTLRC